MENKLLSNYYETFQKDRKKSDTVKIPDSRLPFEDSSFDVVVITEVLEHLPYTDITLSEINRILKPGGKIVGSVPNATRLRNRLRFLFTGVVELDPTHLIHFSSQSLYKRLSNYFEEVKIQPISSRFLFLSKNMFANYLLFKGKVIKAV